MELFSDKWMKKFMDEWNKEHSLSGELKKIGFSSTIAYGFDGDEHPRGVINVKNGKAVSAGTFRGEETMMGLGAAYTTRKLKFANGDYKAMIKEPRMAGPFIKSFTVMGRV